MGEDMIKIINVDLELLIWVGLWGATENILSRYKFSKDDKLFIYFGIAAFAFGMIRLVNGGLTINYSIHE